MSNDREIWTVSTQESIPWSISREELSEIEEADLRSLANFAQATPSAEHGSKKLRRLYEVHILERFDNFAAVFIRRVNQYSDIQAFVLMLQQWCGCVLPTIEREFRPEDTETLVSDDFLSRTGTLMGYVHPSLIAARLAHWRAQAISRVRVQKLDSGRGEVDQDNSSRSSSSVKSLRAACRVNAFRMSKNLTRTELAIQVGTTSKTLGKFFKTGKIRRSIFSDIAAFMGESSEELLAD
jgi:hypothetical protein